MHELSLAMSVMDIVVAEARSHNATRIKEVEIEVGLLAGVEPVCFRTAIDAVIASSPFPDMIAKIKETEGEGKCVDCGERFKARERLPRCPHCGSWACSVEGGEEMRVRSILIDE